MSFKKPFRAPPVKFGPDYRRGQRRAYVALAAKAGAAAVGIGLLVGAISAPDVRAQLAAAQPPLGLTRARPPQSGDYWSGCNDARAAGTAPIYAGEPGYREGMDGDGDGLACEPVPKS